MHANLNKAEIQKRNGTCVRPRMRQKFNSGIFEAFSKIKMISV